MNPLKRENNCPRSCESSHNGVSETFSVSLKICKVTRYNLYFFIFRTYKDDVVDYLNDKDVNAELTLEREYSQNVFSLLKVGKEYKNKDS